MAVLDTTFLVDLQHGEDAAQAALHVLADRPERLIVPAQAAAEYLAGLRDPVAGLKDIESSYDLVGFDSDHILETSQLARQTLREGSFPGWADTQIAATALLTGREVVTANPGAFEPFDVETWDYTTEVREPDG